MPINTHLTYFQKHLFSPLQIEAAPAQNLGMIVVIPCFNEPDLVTSLISLFKCSPTQRPVEVIVVVNSGERAAQSELAQNEKTLIEAKSWSIQHSTAHLSFHILHSPLLPKKHAGVGLARKIGMDEAAARLVQAGNPNGVIVCFDADATCAPNYLSEIERHFKDHPKSGACSIHFEHPLQGDLDADIYRGILYYELYLRYYNRGLRFAGYPHCYHTIGSSMAVRAHLYMQQGGMNRRKAGEDFYFLHKLMPLGNFTEITSTTVFPSPRESDRVPFGTGRAIMQWMDGDRAHYPAESFTSFLELKTFIEWAETSLFEIEKEQLTSALETLPEAMHQYLQAIDFEGIWEELKRHTTQKSTFLARLYRKMNGLKILQFFHFASEKHSPPVPVQTAAEALIKTAYPELYVPEMTLTDLLMVYRKLDKGE